MPIEPEPTTWELPDPNSMSPSDIVGIAADLLPGTLLEAYRKGIFPMPVSGDGEPNMMGWWSPVQRGILPLSGLKISRSLRKAIPKFEIRMNTAFDEVVRQCAISGRSGNWITDEVAAAYRQLHRLGWAHSFESWSRPDGTLVGGLYGIAIGGLFAGESMFHTQTDASKVALVRLVHELSQGGTTLLDVQWLTDHLRSLGAIEVDRRTCTSLLKGALSQPLPKIFIDSAN